MANYIKAIEFDSQLHQKQAVSHVIRSIELEFQKKQTALDLKTPLVQVIYEKLDHLNSSVVQCCCHVLLTCTERGWLHFTGLLNGLLNIMPTTSHPGILLKCLGDLLCYELGVIIKANKDTYQCPYSIRGKKPHPFISVITSCPQLWPRLLALTKQMLLYPMFECQSCIVDMLKPFIKYCLLVPSEEGLPISMDTKMFAMLTSVIHRYLHEAALVDNGHPAAVLKTGQDIVSLLVALLPCFESEQVMEVASWAEELMCCLMRMAPWGCHDDLIGLLCDIVQSVVCELFVSQEHVTLTSLLKSFILLTKVHKKLLHRIHNVFWLSWMLLNCVSHPSYISILLPQVQNLIEGDSPQELLLPFVFPLTVLLCATKTGPIHQIITELLVQVNKKDLSDSEATGSLMAESPTCTSELYSEICTTAQLYYQLCRCSAQKHAWFDSLQRQLEQQELNISSNMRRLLLMMLSSMYLQQDIVIQLSSLEALGKFVKLSPTLCPEVLIFVQYLLSMQGSKELSLKLLYLLPALATHKVMVGRVVRVIHSLSQRISLYPVIIRLLCKVWHERDEVFVHLHKLLIAPLPHHTPPEISREIMLAKVATVHDICHSRPELHAEEMIGLVLQFLAEFSLQNPSMSTGNDDGSTMAMSVKSLHQLCSSEMIDFPAAWNMIAPKLKGERRPKVLVAMCDLFSLIPTLEVDETLQPLCDSALTFLWNCVASTDGSVVEASLKALCNFEPDDFRLVYLPNKLLSLLECVDVATQENALVLSGQQCVQLAAGISPGGFAGYSNFLTRILANELEQFLRGVAHLTQKHLPQLERFARASSQCLSTFISASNGATNLKDCYSVGGLLMAFQLTEPERGSRGYQQQLNNVVKNYKAMWNQCLTVGVSLSSSVYLHQLFSLPYSWATFMNRLYTVYVKSRLLEVCPANMRDDKLSPGYQQKQWEAECWVRCKLVKQLQTVYDDDHLCCVLLSLCGMTSTCLTISDTAGSVEGSVAWLRDWSSSAFLTNILSLLANIIARRENCKETGDNIFSFITKSFKSTTDYSTVICMATVAAVQVIKHIATSFPLVCLFTDMKDNMVAIATNILSNLNVSNERSIVTCYSLCEVLLSTCHQLSKMSSLVDNVVQLCSVTSCNVLSVCMLGQLIPVLCEEGGGAHSVAKKLHKELITGLVMSRYNPATMQFQATCLAVARATPVMYIAGILTLADCKACITILQGLATKLHKCHVIHLSLGTLLCGLVSRCVPDSHQILNEVTAQWTVTIQVQEHSTVLAGLHVMIGSVGCCDMLFSHTSVGTLLRHHLQAVVVTCSTALFNILTHSRVQEEIKDALWMMVQLRAAAMKPITSEHNLPSNYSYLPEERALPAIFECLSNSGVHQSEVVTSSFLCSLGQCSSLPPVDWTGALLSIIRRAPNMCQPCLQCALNLTKTSKGFHTFIVHCCTPLVLSGLEASIQHMVMSKLYHLAPDMSAPSLGDLLGSFCYVCQRKKELLGSFVEGVRQALQLADMEETTVALLQHCVWNICHLLQQFPHLLDYTIHHKTIITDITLCILAMSTGDPHSAAVSLEANIPNTTVLKSLIYSHMISSTSHTQHNFLHSCLTALPEFSSHSDYVLMGLLKSMLNSLRCVNKQDLFNFLTQCMQESIKDSYVCKAEAQLIIKFAFLGSCGGRNSVDLWLGFLGNSKLPAADPHLVCVHANQLVSTLLLRLATSKGSPANLKQLLSQWVIEMALKNVDDLKYFGNYFVVLTNAGSTLWPVWINLV